MSAATARRLMRWASEHHYAAFSEWTLLDYAEAVQRHGNFYCAKRAMLGLLELMEVSK